jgi:hypothetical protein
VVQDLRDRTEDSGYTDLPEFLQDQSEYQSPGDVFSDVDSGVASASGP